MFGFSKRRMKLGRLSKVQLADSTQGAKSPLRPTTTTTTTTKKHTQNNGESVMPPATNGNGSSEDFNLQASTAAINLNKCSSENNETWMVVSTFGDKPTSRSHHAAAVVGSKMVVVGGESGQGLVDDTQILSLDRLTWAAASPKLYLSPSGLPLKIPTCKGHSLVSWGNKILLVGGKTEPTSDKVSVWSFDIETECWSHIEAKGDIPVARGGHTVSRAGQVLILFGGEDTKGRKHNDLHMFDLKSSMWLPLRYTGTGPSPRCDHVASLYDDRILFVFGGKSKSRILNDLYSLDFETMVWSRIKIQGHHPSARAGCCGVLCGTRWYIVGGGSKKKRCAETLIFDVLKLEMYVGVASPPASVTINKGFSLVTVNLKDKVFLVALGGNKKESSNEIEILIIEKEHRSMSWRSGADKNPSMFDNSCTATSMEFGSHLKRNLPPNSNNSSVRHSLASAMEHHPSARRSHSECTNEPNSINGSTSLRKQFHNEGDYVSLLKLQKAIEDDKFEEDNCSQVMEQKNKLPETVVKMDTAGSTANAEDIPTAIDMGNPNTYQRHASGSLLSESENNTVPETDGKQTILATTSSMYQFYERKIAPLSRNNVLLEGQLAAALTSRETSEKNLSSAIKTKQETEKRLADAVKEMVLLKEKVASLELAQEEANTHSNIVHDGNVKLEHDVAFLKAVLDDTQKELHSTRGVLAGERARAFQLQVEVFHLKQRLQSMENLAPTPRKPYQM